jgi:ribosomal protein S12 methylthiotransferase accessory factor
MMSGNMTAYGNNPFEPLVSSFGVVGGVLPARTSWRAESISSFVANAGSRFPARGLTTNRLHMLAAPLLGMGMSLNGADHARLIAMAEAVERYAGRALFQEQTILASANELGGSAIDITRIPRCSSRERQDGSPLRDLDTESRIRWIQGTDWLTGKDVWVPAIMACYGIGDLRETEHFWSPISTGFSVHSDADEALLRALCEVIERDAVEVLWQQMLSLPWIPPHYYPDSVRQLCATGDRQFIDTFLFDATTDIGVPTVYCVHVAPHDPAVRQLVACATRRTFADAAEHAILETFQIRDPVRAENSEGEPGSGSVIDGARYMANPERAAAFDFLLKDTEGRAAKPNDGIPEETTEALAWIKSRLATKQMQVIIVDRTPDELADLGLTALCAIIPDLQPMPLVWRVRYRAHPRLYSAPHLMGYRSLSEEELNPWPQPIA